MTDRELALDLQPYDQKEHGQQAIGDPVLQRHAEGGGAEREAELRCQNA